MPRFSIILPVKNGGDHVKACVKSILAQHCKDFELLVLENASTDGTPEWIASLNDPRIRLFPSSEPLSINENWARVLKVHKSELITLIGHDDLLEPFYLDEMSQLISQFPDASVYMSHFHFIDSKGNTIRKCKPWKGKYSWQEYLEAIMQRKLDINGTGYMLRASDYDSAGGIPMFPNLLFADFKLWTECIRRSYMCVSEKYCFSYRIHQSTTSVSADSAMQDAFGKFVDYLADLKKMEISAAKIIDSNGFNFISSYCQSLAHRLIRRRIDQRGGKSVYDWVLYCQSRAEQLLAEKPPLIKNKPLVAMALWIDKFNWSRDLYLFFRKIIPGPVLK